MGTFGLFDALYYGLLIDYSRLVRSFSLVKRLKGQNGIEKVVVIVVLRPR